MISLKSHWDFVEHHKIPGFVGQCAAVNWLHLTRKELINAAFHFLFAFKMPIKLILS